MDRDVFLNPAIPSPCYIVSESAIDTNLKILDSVQKRTGAKILLALKGFAMFSLFPLIRTVLHGIAASSIDEARLGYEEFQKEVHTCAPAYPDADFEGLLTYSNHITFNSFSQWDHFRPQVLKHPKPVRCGIRVNPEHSEVKTPIYDPCGPCSRLGVTRDRFDPDNLDGITGLHFHTLCELNADSLERTLEVFEKKFGSVLNRMEWVNFGGGHHISRRDYDVNRLCNIITDFKNRHRLTVYLEPGEAIALNTGVMVASVLDIVHNRMDIAILDTSAAAHMPDVLEMPYRPEIIGAGKSGEHAHTYRLAGMTCLAGDVIGDYSFKEPLRVGDRLIFLDMAHYSMVKNNTFNGIRLPSIGIISTDGSFRLIRKFEYADYRNRLS
ncbi:MAG: carboxynorspermidine decarboxylase [Desulfatirhabdiaceae bacterium]